jgi:hypothetical protein
MSLHSENLPSEGPNLESDRALLTFLRQHAPPLPLPALDLEERILVAAVAQSAAAVVGSGAVSSQPAERVGGGRSRPWPWLVPTAVAASLVVGLLDYRPLLQPPPTAQVQSDSTATLEPFIEGTWQATLGDELSPETRDNLF